MEIFLRALETGEIIQESSDGLRQLLKEVGTLVQESRYDSVVLSTIIDKDRWPFRVEATSGEKFWYASNWRILTRTVVI